MLKLIILYIAMTMPFMAQAKLYKIINEYGEVTYTDTAPSIDAKEHKLGKINSVENPLFNKETVKEQAKAKENSGNKE